MRDSDIRALLKDVVGPNIKLGKVGDWVMAPCPLARWTHEKGSDSNPSFGVHVHDSDTSIFNCFTCHKKGPMSYFLQLMQGYTGKDYSRLINSLTLDETYQAELPEWDTCRQLQKHEMPEALPENWPGTAKMRRRHRQWHPAPGRDRRWQAAARRQWRRLLREAPG
jgi:hypothetical protein